jgi:hypothetical protein
LKPGHRCSKKNFDHVHGNRNKNSLDPSEGDFDDDNNVYLKTPISQAKKHPTTLSEAKRDREDEPKCSFNQSLHEAEQHFLELTSDGHVISDNSVRTSLQNKTPVYHQDENEWEDSPPIEEYEFSKTMYDSMLCQS